VREGCPLRPPADPWGGLVKPLVAGGPGDRTGVTSQETLLWRKGLLQPQPWRSLFCHRHVQPRSASGPSASPQGCGPPHGTPRQRGGGGTFLSMQHEICLCRNTCRFLTACSLADPDPPRPGSHRCFRFHHPQLGVCCKSGVQVFFQIFRVGTL